MKLAELFSEKLQNKTAKIGILGMGYVGIPLGLEFAKRQFEVLGFDKDQKRIDDINSGSQIMKHIREKDMRLFVDNGGSATNDFTKINTRDCLIICVPTPLDIHEQPDMSYVENASNLISKNMKKGQLIILESTTYPGTTKELIKPILEKSGLKAGEDFFLAYSPEREDPGNKDFNVSKIPKVIGGYTNECLEVTNLLYKNIVSETVKVSSMETAESTKLMENIFRAVNIAMVNEMKLILSRMNVNIWEVIEAAKTKPFGFQAFYPGPGVGGHCIPVDPYYLSWIAKENKVQTNLIFHAGKINSQMPNWIISEILLKKKIKKVLLIGAAYKKGLDDTRESPTIDFIRIFKKKKIKTDYYDPNVKYLKSRKLNKTYISKKLNEEILKKYDCTIILTDHTNINYDLIKKNANFIVDTRNIYKIKSNKILKL